MARSREEVISEMVDSGLFSDDEIRNAAKKSPQPPADKYGDLKTAVSNTAHFGLPVLGASLMGGATSPALFTGAPLVAGAAGFAAGAGAARKLDDLMGLKKPLPVKEEFSQTGNDLQTGALAELVPQAAIKTGGAVLQGLKNNPQIIGSAIDAMGGLPSGTARVAIQNPEITQAGYYTFGKIKDFASKLHEGLNELEDTAQKKWAGLRDSIDASHGGAGKVDRFSVAKAIQEAKEQLGLKGPQYTPGESSLYSVREQPPDLQFNPTRPNQGLSAADSPLERRTPKLLIEQPKDKFGAYGEGPLYQPPTMRSVEQSGPDSVYGSGNITKQNRPPLKFVSGGEIPSPQAPKRIGSYGEELSSPTPEAIHPKAGPGKISNKDSGSAAEAISNIESKFNSMLEPATYGGQQAKSRLNLRDLTDLRQTIDSHINWESNGGPAISKNEQRIFKGLRGQVDSLIAKTPEYSQFKTNADQPFSDMINTSKQARSTFGIKAGKDLEDLTTDELKQIENKVKGSLKKGGAEREAIAAMDKKLNTGMSILDEAEKLAASGGATPERALPFERTLRPGTGYALLNSAGLGGAGASLALHHPLAAAGVLAGQGASMALTSPRMIGLGIRSAQPLMNSAAAAAPTMSRELAALIQMAMEKRRRQNAQ